MLKKYYPLFLCALIVVISLFAYRGVTHLFPFNDEWGELGAVYKYGLRASLNDVPVVQLLLGKNRLLGSFINNIFFLHYGVNVGPIAVLGLIFHCINAWLIYLIAKKATKNIFISSVAALFFVSASVASQAMTWPAATVQTILSVTFMLLSLYFAFVYQQTKSWKYMPFVLLALYISFLIKDNTIILLPAIISLPFLYGINHFTLRRIPWYVWILAFLLLLLAVYKTVMYFHLSPSNFLSPFMVQSYVRWMINILYYPIVSVSHFFVPFPYMLRLAHGVGWYYSVLQRPPFGGVAFELLSETVLSDIVSLFLSIGIIIAMYKLCRKYRPYYPILIFFILFYLLNFVPIALFLNERNTSYIESRYMYACAVPFAILLGVSLENLRKVLSAKVHISLRNATIIVGAVFMFFVYKQSIVIQRDVLTAVRESDQARNTIHMFTQMQLRLPDKPIIYLESDSTYYVAAPVPFQLGPGYVLMITYYPTGVVPVDLLVGTPQHYYPFLYNYIDDGYRELDGKGFGYFTDKNNLLSEYISHPSITIDQVIGFRYSGSTGRMTDITSEIRNFLLTSAPLLNR